MSLDYKKIYYYTICLITFFVLLWGTIDLSSAVASLTILKPTIIKEIPEEKISEGLEDAYQQKMLFDRLGDSLARIVIAGIIFAYSRKKIADIEGE